MTNGLKRSLKLKCFTIKMLVNYAFKGETINLAKICVSYCRVISLNSGSEITLNLRNRFSFNSGDIFCRLIEARGTFKEHTLIFSTGHDESTIVGQRQGLRIGVCPDM